MIPSFLAPGYIGTLAGTGEPGFSGDGGPAVSARLSEPKQLVFDQYGNLYIADSENHCIRMVDRRTGIISTVAGLPCQTHAENEPPIDQPSQAHLEEDPLDKGLDVPTNQFRHTADLSGTVRYSIGQGHSAIRFAGDGGPAVNALLNFPSALAVEEGVAVYIADMLNHRIRRVDLATGIITTLAGTGQAKWKGDGGPAREAALNEPVALALDRARRQLYVADQSNNRVRVIDLTTGIITTIAGTGEAAYTGDGPALEVALAGPSGLALDAVGHLYIADTFNGRIRKLDTDTGMLETALGDGHAFRFDGAASEQSMSVARPYGIAFDRQGQLLITDSDNHLLRKWDPRGSMISIVAGDGQARFAGDNGPADKSSLNYPFGVAVDPWGHIAIADTFNHRIRLIVAPSPHQR
ncbi:MAG: hypothetical protein D6690_09945 [Nitrospirae bacterium]|nr:MAG: hypothetical protein D6690_09945 [Nitrospirota bacterium]